jgi:hypothetical protein
VDGALEEQFKFLDPSFVRGFFVLVVLPGLLREFDQVLSLERR